jgi:aryl-alcohol dehydrogenase-like predicted oxidoreductase
VSDKPNCLIEWFHLHHPCRDDQIDARTLARLARIDAGLSGPVRHRSAQAQIQLAVIRARAVLVSTRTALVNAARGLTKSYGQRLKKCGTEQMKPFVDQITQLAKKKNATTAQLSLAWLLAQKSFIVPIPGTSKVEYLQENINATTLELSTADLKEIDNTLSKFEVHGGRMNEQRMKVVEE